MILEKDKVTIRGRLVDETSKPIVGITVIVCEVSADEVKRGRFSISWRTGKDGKQINPAGKSGKDGKFKIEADKKFWQKTGLFILKGNFLPGTTLNDGVLTGPGGHPLVVLTDRTTSTIDLGEITVKKPEH